jgi:cation diffusion facilitator family transporter
VTRERSTLVVAAAAGANLAVAAAKLAAAAASSSPSLLAEGIHSLADTGNELLLFIGLRRSRRPPDEDHPYGHGKELFFWGLLVGLLLFAVGGGMSIYEGLERLFRPREERIVGWHFAVLGAAAIFEGASFRFALSAVPKKARRSVLRAVRFGKDPAVYTVLAEDAAALIGVGLAAIGLVLQKLGVPHADAAASLAIGALLCGVAVVLVWEARGLLIGERASPEVVEAVRRIAREDPAVEEVGEPLTMQLGAGEVLLNVAMRFSPDLRSGELADAIERITSRIRRERPEVTHVFIEAQPPGRQDRHVEGAHRGGPDEAPPAC